jgi:hypothetical protein
VVILGSSWKKNKIANIFLANCTVAARSITTTNAALTTRYKFNTKIGGVVDVDKCGMCHGIWFFITLCP